MTATHPEANSDLMSCSQVENRTPVEHADCAYGSSRRCTGRRERQSEGRVGDQGSARCDFMGYAFGRMYSPVAGKRGWAIGRQRRASSGHLMEIITHPTASVLWRRTKRIGSAARSGTAEA